MKRQILLSLAAIAVVATAFTTNVLAQQGRGRGDRNEVRMRQCGQDIQCVGQVLLDAVQMNNRTVITRPDPRPAVTKTVMFYHSDTCQNNYLAQVSFTGDPAIDEQSCRDKANEVSENVWAVKEFNNGTCVNISDTSFMSACVNSMMSQ